MIKYCLACCVIIEKFSKQWANQKYCTAKCRKVGNLKHKSSKTRAEQKRANLRQNDEVLYLVAQCRKAKTVQILDGHDLESFIKTMELVRNRPAGDVNLCHIAPVKGKGFKGLFHHMNLFYGGAHQNKRFKNNYISGGLLIGDDKLKARWCVTQCMSINDVLVKIEKFLGCIVSEYIQACPVRKSKKVQIANKIIELDGTKHIDDLLASSYECLVGQWQSISNIRIPVFSVLKRESKYLAYMDSLTRFIFFGEGRQSVFKELRRLMVVGYMALERVEASRTYNKYFYIKYEPLINVKFGQAMLRDSADWPEFKDLMYSAAFHVLQGGDLDIKSFRKKLMSYLIFPDRAWVVEAAF